MLPSSPLPPTRDAFVARCCRYVAQPAHKWRNLTHTARNGQCASIVRKVAIKCGETEGQEEVALPPVLPSGGKEAYSPPLAAQRSNNGNPGVCCRGFRLGRLYYTASVLLLSPVHQTAVSPELSTADNEEEVEEAAEETGSAVWAYAAMTFSLFTVLVYLLFVPLLIIALI